MSENQTKEPPFLLASILQSTMPKRIEVLDIGAMAEHTPRYDALSRQGICRVTGFEANQDQIGSSLAAMPAGSVVLPYALGDGRPGTLHVTRYPGCSSLLESNAEVIEMFVSIGASSPTGNFHVVERRPIETHRLDDIPECPSADYLKLDVQGAELMIMQNGLEKLSKAVVIETEVEFVEVYCGQPLMGEIQVFLREHGFVLHKLIDISGRNFRPFGVKNPIDATSQFLWADAVFVKDFSRLRDYTPAQMLTAAVILHDAYLSYDMAHLMLYAYDIVTGSVFAETYREKLGDISMLPRMFANIRTEL